MCVYYFAFVFDMSKCVLLYIFSITDHTNHTELFRVKLQWFLS